MLNTILCIGIIFGYIGLIRDNGKEAGNYYIIIGYMLGIYWDNGKENGNYYSGFVVEAPAKDSLQGECAWPAA